MKRTITATAAVLGILVLGACSVTASANRTVGAEQIAEEAEGALEEQVGQRPDIDCGDDQVDLVDGEVVDCELTDPTTGDEYDTTVTLSDVDGTNFNIDVQVAQEAND
ncbi:DUF4333 domain-containing protein [Serinibacter arcticus]|uniref:Uncharacterized protein n=1 Tax=Serinibacter arcticus TaxID=1655435 RepID=A0A4Z1E643_9MICO|nr:hypothetical protein [Serinibacter arcticus]TGO06619.1 hypothetical protein SERN_0811 [Serinibacter arcticus]